MNESKPKSVECLEAGPIWPKQREPWTNKSGLSEEEFKRLYLGTWKSDYYNSGLRNPGTDPRSKTWG